MDSEDLERELNRLWQKVSPAGSDVERPAVLPTFGTEMLSASRDATAEAMALMKRQHQEQLAHWEEMLELKEEAVQALTQRLHESERETIELRRKLSQFDQRLIAEVSDAAMRLEAADRAIKAQEERFHREGALLREIAEKTRQQLAGETSRWRELDRQWAEREQQYLDDLHRMQEKLAQAEKKSGEDQQKSIKLSDEIASAKRAMESTLAELISERRLREDADRVREEALTKATDLTERLKGAQKIWDEERKQWQELWDRERSTWETQRQEVAQWEERLRKEREEWHAQLKSKEDQELKFAERMTQSLRESSDATQKIQEVLTLVQGAKVAIHRYRPGAKAKQIALGVVAAFALGVLSYSGYKYFTRFRFELVASQSLKLDNPTSIAFDGVALWAAQWSGSVVSLDPSNPGVLLARYEVKSGNAFRPVAIAIGGEALYALDSASGKILKLALADPSQILGGWPSPGPAPVTITHDGRNLWSYDAVTHSLYRHMGEGQGASVDVFNVPTDIVPSSMQWLGEELWLHDSKAHQLLRVKLSEKTIRILAAYDFSPRVSFIAAASSGRKPPTRALWTLISPVGDGQPYALEKFLVRH